MNNQTRDSRAVGNPAHQPPATSGAGVLGECILWNKCRNKKGYGYMTHKGKTRTAHRVAWEERHGPIPDGLMVLHRCDTPACINVDHLFLGDAFANMQDAARKGRMKIPIKWGEQNNNSKLTSDAVTFIRIHYKQWCRMNGASNLARRFSVDVSTVRRVLSGETWKHVGGDE